MPPDNTPAPVAAGFPSGPLVPRSIAEVMQLAELVCRAGLARKGQSRPEQVALAIMHGMELGLSPLQGLQSVYVVNGRAALEGDAALALVLARGVVADWEEGLRGEGDERCAFVRSLRQGSERWREHVFSVADARAAGLWGREGPWRQYPDRMLRYRALGFHLRGVYPDVLRGLHTVEELQDRDGDEDPPLGGPTHEDPPLLPEPAVAPEPAAAVLASPAEHQDLARRRRAADRFRGAMEAAGLAPERWDEVVRTAFRGLGPWGWEDVEACRVEVPVLTAAWLHLAND